MAYMNKEKKERIAANIKPILAKYGLKGTLSIQHHSSITLTVQSGKLDFDADRVAHDDTRHREYINVNPFHPHIDVQGKALECVRELIDALNSADNYDRSDIMTDYFDVGYYIHLNIGTPEKLYTLSP